MGDRANVVIKDSDSQVCLYTHWSGSDLPEILKAALIRGKSRWNDRAYLARIIFCEMVRGSEMELTGYGISQNIGDGGDNVIYVDIDAQTVTHRGRELSFAAFSGE